MGITKCCGKYVHLFAQAAHSQSFNLHGHTILSNCVELKGAQAMTKGRQDLIRVIVSWCDPLGKHIVLVLVACTLLMGWLKGKSTGNQRFSHEIWDVPVILPLNQSIDTSFRPHFFFLQISAVLPYVSYLLSATPSSSCLRSFHSITSDLSALSFTHWIHILFSYCHCIFFGSIAWSRR